MHPENAPFYAISAEDSSLSPHRMRFGPWWIYNLSSFHSFWRKRIESDPAFFCDQAIWGVLLKAYSIHLFSPLKKLEPLAIDYFSSTQIPRGQSRSLSKIRENMDCFSNLGLKKIESLRKLSREGMQYRFGPAWGKLWEGIFEPSQAAWLWEAAPESEVIRQKEELDDPCGDHPQIVEAIRRRLKYIGQENLRLRVQKIILSLITSQNDEDIPPLEISFSYTPLLDCENNWICKLLSEQLITLSLTSPVTQFCLEIHPATPRKEEQLALFQSPQGDILSFRKRLQNFANKMKDMNISVFEPEEQPSHLPEKSWRAQMPQHEFKPSFQNPFRPLVLNEPKKILKCEKEIRGHLLKESERLRWFDENGVVHERHYYWMRDLRCWRWIFRDETGAWFSQGILE